MVTVGARPGCSMWPCNSRAQVSPGTRRARKLVQRHSGLGIPDTDAHPALLPALGLQGPCGLFPAENTWLSVSYLGGKGLLHPAQGRMGDEGVLPLRTREASFPAVRSIVRTVWCHQFPRLRGSRVRCLRGDHDAAAVGGRRLTTGSDGPRLLALLLPEFHGCPPTPLFFPGSLCL